MKLTLLIALLIGTQIGLSDGLILPTLVAQHGGGSFIAAYAFFKILVILPILQAELVAGRLYRVTPFEFSFLVMNKSWARIFFGILLMAVIFVLATNLFNTAWAMIFAIDGIQGDLLSLRPLDQNLYWYQQTQDINRIMSFVIMQGMLLMLLGGLAWRGIAYLFMAVVPLIALFVLFRLPAIVHLLFTIDWQPMAWADILVVMQHGLTSSMVGLLVWYVLGTKMSDHLPTGRVIIFVQVFDVLFGLALLSISWAWVAPVDLSSVTEGNILRILIGVLSEESAQPLSISLWLLVISFVGLFSSLPLLLLVAPENNLNLRQWLLAATVLLVVGLSAILILSHGVDSPLTWYGLPIYDVIQRVGQGVIVPTITAGIAIWIGWIVWPNRVLLQINPHGGFRYFLWRIVLKFVVPLVLGLVFARAAMSLLTVSPSIALIGVLAILIIIRLVSWVKKRAIFPDL